MKPKHTYLTLCTLGIALPYWQFLPWVAANGLNLNLMVHLLFANRVSAFFVMDVLVSAITLLIFARSERSHLSPIARRLPMLAVLTVGVSLALPLFLYLRESSENESRLQ